MDILRKLYVFTIVMHIFCFSSAEHDANEMNDLINTLDTLLDYIEDNPKEINADGLFGVVLAEANFNLILNLDLHKNFLEKMKTIRQRIYKIRKTGYIRVSSGTITGPYETIITLLNPSMWMKPPEFVSGYILPLGAKWRDKYPFKGTPNEYTSDMCISHLLESILTQEECEILNMCENYYFSPNTRVHGYPLTHRLLFWQVFTAINCSDYYDVPSIKLELCTRILSEAKGIVAAKNFTYNVLRDLFLEQVVLCASEGYGEFLTNKRWRETILNWQNEKGCFNTEIKDKDMSKSTETCLSHTSGLAAAYLALNIRFIILSKYT